MGPVRVFIAGQQICHLLACHIDETAICGRRAWPGFWLGTRTDERETAKALPICITCLRKAKGEL